MALHDTPQPAVDLTRDWHDNDEARALIAEVAASPVKIFHRTVYVQTADEWWTYTGEAARQLYAMSARYGDAAFAASTAAYELFASQHGREPDDAEYADLYRAFHRYAEQPVERVVADAIAALGTAEPLNADALNAALRDPAGHQAERRAGQAAVDQLFAAHDARQAQRQQERWAAEERAA